MKTALVMLGALALTGQVLMCASHLGEYGHDDEFFNDMEACSARHVPAVEVDTALCFEHPRIVVADGMIITPSLWSKLVRLLEQLDGNAASFDAGKGDLVLHVACIVPSTIEGILLSRRVTEALETFSTITLQDKADIFNITDIAVEVDIRLQRQQAGTYVDMGDSDLPDEALLFIDQQKNRILLQLLARCAGLQKKPMHGWRFSDKSA